MEIETVAIQPDNEGSCCGADAEEDQVKKTLTKRVLKGTFGEFVS
jgi:hypothetical protein